jgi:phage-related protein
MTFDAGAIEATLTLKRDQFQRDLKAAEAQYDALKKKFDQDITIRVRVEGGGSVSTTDKINTKEGTQGGLLGSDSNLLKKLEQEANNPGGIGLIGTGTDTTLQRLLRQQLEKAAVGGAQTSVMGTGAANTDTSKVVQDVVQKVTGTQGEGAPGEVTQKVLQDYVAEGNGAPASTTEQVKLNVDSNDLRQQVEQAIGTGATDQVKLSVDSGDLKEQVDKAIGPGATEPIKLKEEIDQTSADKVKEEVAKSGDDAGTSFSSKFKANILKNFASGGSGGSAGDAGKHFAGDFDNGLVGGIGPGVAGLSAKLTTIFALGGSLLGGLPAIGGLAGVGIGVAMIGGLVGELAAKDPQIKAAFTKIGPEILSTLETAFKPLVPVILNVINQIMPLIKSIAPALTGIFKVIGPTIEPIFQGIAVVVKDLVQVMQAAAPAFGPFIEALLSLVKNILPPLITGIRATVPFIGMFGATLATLGTDLGSIFNSAGPAIKASMTILDALLGLIGSMLPSIMSLASALAVALAPAFTLLGGVIRSLEPVISIIGTVIAGLGKAVLGDLVGAFGAVATLLMNMAPGLKIVAQALAQLFAVLENTGVFATLGDVLEKLAAPLGNLFNVLVEELAPVFPILIQALGQLVNAFILLASAGLVVVIKVISELLVLIQPLLNLFVDLLKSVGPLAPVLLAVGLAFLKFNDIIKLVGIAWKALNVILDLDPFVLIGLAIIAVALVVVKYHKQIWDTITTTWGDIMSFIKAWWPVFIGVATGGLGLLIAAVIKYHTDIENFIKTTWNAIYAFFKAIFTTIADFFVTQWNAMYAEVQKAWNEIETFIKNVWNAIYDFLKSGVTTLISFLSGGWDTIYVDVENSWNKVLSFFQRIWDDLKSGFDTVVSEIGTAWDKLENVFKGPVDFLINTVYDNGIARLWNDVMGAVGGPKLPVVTGMSTGGKIPGYGGGDSFLAMLEPGESVVPKHLTGMLAPLLHSLGVPGFQGGIIGDIWTGITSSFDKIVDIGKITAALMTGNTTALANGLDKFIGTHASGELGTMMVDIPTTIIKAAVKSIANAVFGVGKGGKMDATETQIAKWWTGAGGPGEVAHVAAAITGAESGFNTQAVQQGQPYATTGWGLWQITPGDSEPQFGINQALLNGPQNAGAAVAKYRGAGGSFSPWTTYEDGAYLKFMDAGGMLPQGASLVYKATAAPERVLNPTETQLWNAFSGKELLDRLDTLIDLAQKAPRSTAAGVSGALGGVARGAVYNALYSSR